MYALLISPHHNCFSFPVSSPASPTAHTFLQLLYQLLALSGDQGGTRPVNQNLEQLLQNLEIWEWLKDKKNAVNTAQDK